MSARSAARAQARPEVRPTSGADVVTPTPSARGVVGLLAATVLALLVPGLLVDGTGGGKSVLAVAVIALSGLRLSWLLGRGEPRGMELSFWTFTYVFLGLAPLVQFQRGDYPNTTPWFFMDRLDDAMWAILIGSAAALVGLWLGARRPWHVSPDKLQSDVSQTRTFVLAGVALALNVYYLSRVGPGALVSNRERLRGLHEVLWSDAGLGVLVVAGCTLPLLVAFLAFLRLNQQRAALSRPRLLVWPLLTGAAVLFSVNPISSPRYVTGTVILAMLAGLGAYATPARVRISSLGFIAGLAFVFPLADAFRSQGPVTETFDPVVALTNGDFDGAVQTSSALHIISADGISWGYQLLGVPLFWVPRSVWPDKPIGTGAFIAERMGYDLTNLSSPLVAEMLVNGGWGLLVIGMLAFGWWMRSRDDVVSAVVARGMRPSPLVWVLPIYLLIMVRGSLQSAAVQLSVLLLADWFVRARSRPGPNDGI